MAPINAGFKGTNLSLSRGSMVLKAALNDRNNKLISSFSEGSYKRLPLQDGVVQEQLDYIISHTTITPPKDYNSHNIGLASSMSKKPKSSKKERVLFSNPEVTNKFTYEPTIVYHYDPASDETRNKKFIESPLEESTSCSEGNRETGNVTIRTNSNKFITKRTQSNGTPRKRPYQAVDKQQKKREGITDISDNITTSAHQTPPKCAQVATTNSNHRQESLFSPPKIAKVEPYFPDNIDETKTTNMTTDLLETEQIMSVTSTFNGTPVQLQDEHSLDIQQTCKKIDECDEDEDTYQDALDFIEKSNEQNDIKPEGNGTHISGYLKSLLFAWRQVSPT